MFESMLRHIQAKSGGSRTHNPMIWGSVTTTAKLSRDYVVSHAVMDMQITHYQEQHLEGVVRLSLRAWAPVFASLQEVMDPELYQAFFPDWRVHQQAAVEHVCHSEDYHIRVALSAGSPVGFVAVKLHREEAMGEIYMVAVDPDAQGHGVGAALTAFALDWMKEAGMAVAMVETGGDPGHAPARRTYEKFGFRLFPVARYFKKL